jgi:hypothetical protein
MSAVGERISFVTGLLRRTTRAARNDIYPVIARPRGRGDLVAHGTDFKPASKWILDRVQNAL